MSSSFLESMRKFLGSVSQVNDAMTGNDDEDDDETYGAPIPPTRLRQDRSDPNPRNSDPLEITRVAYRAPRERRTSTGTTLRAVSEDIRLKETLAEPRFISVDLRYQQFRNMCLDKGPTESILKFARKNSPWGLKSFTQYLSMRDVDNKTLLLAHEMRALGIPMYDLEHIEGPGMNDVNSFTLGKALVRNPIPSYLLACVNSFDLNNLYENRFMEITFLPSLSMEISNLERFMREKKYRIEIMDFHTASDEFYPDRKDILAEDAKAYSFVKSTALQIYGNEAKGKNLEYLFKVTLMLRKKILELKKDSYKRGPKVLLLEAIKRNETYRDILGCFVEVGTQETDNEILELAYKLARTKKIVTTDILGDWMYLRAVLTFLECKKNNVPWDFYMKKFQDDIL